MLLSILLGFGIIHGIFYEICLAIHIVIATMALHNYIIKCSQNHYNLNEAIDEPSYSICEHTSNITSHKKSYDTADDTAQDIII